MSRMILELSNEGRCLSVVQGFFKISEAGKELGRVPCEDVGAVILTAYSATITKQAIARMAAEKVIGVVCGDNFMPSAMILPISGHFESGGILQNQIKASKPLQKRIWQTLIVGKIANQRSVVRHLKPESSSVIKKLEAAQRKVLSGDSSNMEGYAARLYWGGLMGNGFKRDSDGGGVNSLLNYGYAVLRSVVARAVCAAGLNPAIGVHHHNRLNPYCLVDDLMEPLRPLVDLKVKQVGKEQGELTPDTKRALAEVRFSRAKVGKITYDLCGAANRMAQLLVEGYSAGKNMMVSPVACLR